MMIGGKWPQKERSMKHLLTALNALEFYEQGQPKSLGYEFIADVVLPIIANIDLTLEDIA